jgi:ABC-type uncharacterized transport system permease subunit
MNVYQRLCVFIARFIGLYAVVVGLERFVSGVVISTTMASTIFLTIVGSIIYVFSAKIGIELGKGLDDLRVELMGPMDADEG